MNQYIPTLTKKILIICGILFLLKNILPINLDVILGAFYPQSPNFKVYQIITHIFMHGDFLHFIFNMFAIYMFGSAIEITIGTKKYFILYFSCGLGAFFIFQLVNFFEIYNILQNINESNLDISNINSYSKLSFLKSLESQKFNNQQEWLRTFNNLTYQQSYDLHKLFSNLTVPVIGASGAIFGILVVFAVLYPNVELMILFIPFPIKAKYLISFYILVEFYLGIQNNPSDNIAHFAHLGGALFGYFLIKYWQKKHIV